MPAKNLITQTISLLNTDHVQLDCNWNYKNVISPYHRIYYIDKGEAFIEDRFNSLKLEPGFIYIIPSYTLCNLVCSTYLSQYFVQFFEESSNGSSFFGNAHFVYKTPAREIDIINFKRLIEINPGRGLDRSDDPKIYESPIYYTYYQKLNEIQSHSDFIETQGILLQLISRFSIIGQFHTEQHGNIPLKMLDAIRYISINLHQEISVKMLAEQYSCNAEHFSRLFLRHVGIRPQAYIIQKRIDRAKHMMSSQAISLGEIAERTGFGSLSSFSRVFKQETGFSPRAYKNNNH